MTDARQLLKAKLERDIELLEDQVELTKSGRLKTFRLDPHGNKRPDDDQVVARNEGIIANLKAVVERLGE